MKDDKWRVLAGLNIRYGAHMGKYERRVWDAYCEQLKDIPDQIYYDVPLGTELNNWKDVRTGKKHHRDPWANWRCDAVMVYKDRIIVVEVKNRANLQALGQLFAYPTLFEMTYPMDIPVLPLLVAAQIPLPIYGLLKHFEIGCDQVEIAHGEAVAPTYPLFDQAKEKETG